MCVTCQENNIFLSDVPVQPETPFEEETVEAFLDRLETEIIVVETALDKYLDKCASIDELENYADEIGSLDAVANVSVSNDGMFITTKEGFKISVLYTVCDSTLYDNVELESTISAYATRSQVGSDDHDFVDLREKKICIINQTTKDKNFVEQDLNFRKLIGDIKKAGYKNVDYITATSADVMWFFEKMTEYDVILLCTHGGLDANDEDYVFATGEELPLDIDKQDVHLLKGRAFLKYFLDSDRLTVEQKDKLFSSISLVILNEMRVKEGQLEEHKYFGLTSKAIELIKGDFNDAVIFSTACSGYIIASAFNNKGATYLGYTDTNSVGPFAGCDFMLNMLKGMSVVEARENLKGDYKLEEKTDWKPDNSNKSYTFTSKLCIAGNEKICIVHPEVSTGDVNVDGFNAVLHGSVKGTNNIMECKAAFCYSKNKNDLEIGKSGVDSTAWNVIEGDLEKEVKFEAELKSLKENTEYYYRAVVKSEENYFYGEVKSFKTEEGYSEFVDLGLSVLWARCNVGANSPEESGGYYAWGETNGDKSEYSWETYEHIYQGSLNMYCNDKYLGKVDNYTTLINDSIHDDDVAAQLSSGRMPTKKEFQELADNCKWIWSERNGVKGFEVIGKDENRIFIPASGYRGGIVADADGVTSYNEAAYYWTRNLFCEYDPEDIYYGGARCNNSWYFYFLGNSSRGLLYMERFYGMPVRPVQDILP